MVNKKPLSLGRRVLFSGLLAGLMVAVLVGTLAFPQWKLHQELRTLMAAHGETGTGQLLWQGRMKGYTGKYTTLLRRGGGRLYLGWLASYEGRPGIQVFSGSLPEEPAVTLLLNDIYAVTDMPYGRMAWRARGGYACQLIGVSLPEGTAGGRLSVTLGPEIVRETEGFWSQGLLIFAPPAQWVEYEWGLKKDGIRPYHTGTLADRPYTLTLWDEEGTVISQTSGTLGSIWGR